MKNTVSMALTVGAAMTIAGAALATGPQLSLRAATNLFNHDGSVFTPTSGTEDPTGTYDIISALGDATGTFLIGDPTQPGSGADDVVNFDGIDENITSDFLGNQRTASESFSVDPATGTQTINISLIGPDLFPGGFTDPNTGDALDTAVFFIGGLGDTVDFVGGPPGLKFASIDAFDSSGASIFGGAVDIGPSGLDFLANPWDGFVGISFGAGTTGIGINRVDVVAIVNKASANAPTPGAIALFGIAGLATLRRRR